jgi:hypothetical protein
MEEHDVPPEVRDAIVKTPRYQRMERGIEEPQIKHRRRQQMGAPPGMPRGLRRGNRGNPAMRQSGQSRSAPSQQQPDDGTQEPGSDS